MFSPPYLSAMEDLYGTQPRMLDTFISGFLQPNKEFLRKMNGAIHSLYLFFKNNSFTDASWPRSRRPRVMNVVKGGSLERGTALKGSSDADLVLFLDIFEDDVQDQERVQKEIIQQIGRRLKKWQELLDLDVSIELTKQENPRGFSIKLRSYNFTESMALNVVPAYNAMGQYNGDYTPDPQVYIKLKEASSHPGEFSNCFTELQKEFISQCPPQVKSLIRLVKYWFKKYICQYKSRLRKGESLPPKYALELLAVYAWQRGSHQTDFDMAEGFQTVLWLIEHYKELCIYWTTYYDFENETISRYLQGQLQKPRPVILDPADPTKNLGEGSRWDLVAEEAKCASQQKCFIHQLDYISPWNVPTFPKEDLYNTKPNKLDKFIFDFLQPNKEFLDKMNRAINSICAFFRDSCFTDTSWSQFRQPRVLKVVKGGSLGKGTALKGSSDADMVLFLKSFEGYTDQKKTQTEIILKIKERLKEWQNQTPFDMSIDEKWNTPRSISFELCSSGFTESIKFDVLPAYDALGQYNGDYKPDPQVYIKLIKAGGSAGEFSRCFTELQRNFISRCDTKVKNLIRLVKYWYRKYKLRLRGKASLPPKYAMELLAVYAWERGSGNPNFDTAEGFRTVLWLIEHYKELCIFWTTYYDFENETIKQHLQEQLQKPRPVILDPADPTGNLGESGRWDLLAQEAKRASHQKCFMHDQGYQISPWDVPTFAQGDLYNTKPNKLDKFIFDFLQPNKEFLDKMNRAINSICAFFRDYCFTDASWSQFCQPRVLKVVKGGSLGKGTALKGSSDADMVLFLKSFEGYTDQKKTQTEIILKIKERLKEWQKQTQFDMSIDEKWNTPRSISFELSSSGFTEPIKFDVLPAYDALGQYDGDYKPDPQVYIKLIRAGGSAGEFSRCFTELQRNFISRCDTKVKNLIRLVKYWYRKYKLRLRGKASLPPKYAMELLAVYAWERGSGNPNFDTAEGFRTVLWLIEHYKELCIFWTTYYDFENETIKQHLQEQLQKPRPVILDPADPTGNLGESGGWDLLAQEAKRASCQKCFMRDQGYQVLPWDVPVHLSGLDGSVFSLPYISAMEDLYNTEPRKLDRFISMFLQPNKEFLDKMNEAVDRICTFFKNKCFTDPSGPQSQRLPRVPKVVKGGSLGKGTALKGSSDADLVLFLDIFKDYTDQKNTQSGIILEIKEKLKDWQDFDVFIQPTKRENPRVLSFELQSYDFTETIEFDVLPAYDAMGQISNTKPDPQVYVKLIEARGQPGEFSRCFTELQKTFISQRPTKVKSLIRLVKYWYKKYVLPCKSQLREGESLPPKYALELLAVYAWEKGSREPDFDMAEGFQTVLWLIENYKQLCIFWTKSYDFEDLAIKRYLQGQLLKRRPVILDPADPTGNLGEGARWDLLAQEAKSGSRQKCLKYQNVYISPWKVPLQVPWEDDRSYGTIVKQFLQGFF